MQQMQANGSTGTGNDGKRWTRILDGMSVASRSGMGPLKKSTTQTNYADMWHVGHASNHVSVNLAAASSSMSKQLADNSKLGCETKGVIKVPVFHCVVMIVTPRKFREELGSGCYRSKHGLCNKAVIHMHTLLFFLFVVIFLFNLFFFFLYLIRFIFLFLSLFFCSCCYYSFYCILFYMNFVFFSFVFSFSFLFVLFSFFFFLF